MHREPWLHFWRLKDDASRKAIDECLRKAGICVRALDPSAPRGEGILCFSHFNEDLCKFLREVSHNREERVLAIPVADAAVDTSSVWQLMRAGASDVLAWSADAADLIKARFQRWHAVDELVESEAVRSKLVGASPIWRSVLRQIIEVTRFTGASVLLIGESGTGKELIARLIHELYPRASSNEFVILDCTTIVPELSGSEFFGHERGAFTGAVGARDGAFAAANGGTLFLDEVGELPLPLQAQLLRVVQEGTYKRVGGNVWNRAEFRLVCATNKSLPQAIERGEFRSDLYYRIASWVFRVPSLHERCEDILPLARHFLRLFQPDNPRHEFDPAVREYLLSRPYPGNVRDLRQLIARISSRHVGPGPITVGDVPADERPQGGPTRGNWRDGDFERSIRQALAMGVGLKEISQAAADTAMRIAVASENGNLQLAARQLGVTDRALQMRRAARRKYDGGTQLQDAD
jgi:transcriptional regulator with GAF, ATPase, and Fis domain